MEKRVIDLRSDTLTQPTEEMREAMRNAVVGDDVWGEDPTVKRLEEMAAERLGKEAALFVASGTMGNQVALMTHCSRGDEVIMEEGCHIYNYEVAAASVISGLQARPLKGNYGILDPGDVKRAIRPPDIHHPRTGLICLENSHNRAGGTVYPLEVTREIGRIAREAGLPIHLDGARIFNAAIALVLEARELAQDADSVMFCLSKGLAAPVGSLLLGNRDFIYRARRNRKMLGGGMRQVGILAAAGIVALEKMVDRLSEDNANARALAEGIAHIPGIHLDLQAVQTNIVIFFVQSPKMSAPSLVKELASEGIKVHLISANSIRMVTHKDVDREDVERTIEAITTNMGR